jgi:hypothetical protein
MATLVASGRTEPYNTDWQPHQGTTGIYVDIDTSWAGFTDPVYVTSLGGETQHWKTTGASSIYNATPEGFRVYVRWADGKPLRPDDANDKGWHINWVATGT